MAIIKLQREGKVVDEVEWRAEELEITERPNGPAAAAMLAGGLGVAVLGVLTTLNEASADIHDFLEFWKDVGPLSGKTLIATGAFFVSWVAFAPMMWTRNVRWDLAILVTAVLLVIGFVGTFPEFFQLFAEE
jgi:hypothetical protein